VERKKDFFGFAVPGELDLTHTMGFHAFGVGLKLEVRGTCEYVVLML